MCNYSLFSSILLLCRPFRRTSGRACSHNMPQDRRHQLRNPKAAHTKLSSQSLVLYLQYASHSRTSGKHARKQEAR